MLSARAHSVRPSIFSNHWKHPTWRLLRKTPFFQSLEGWPGEGSAFFQCLENPANPIIRYSIIPFSGYHQMR
jgi:hypothetical protein